MPKRHVRVVHHLHAVRERARGHEPRPRELRITSVIARAIPVAGVAAVKVAVVLAVIGVSGGDIAVAALVVAAAVVIVAARLR